MKNILIGFILGLFFIAAYVSAGNGTIGQLFKDLGGGNGWVLIGDNIEDGTIDSSEIEDKTITNKDIAIGTIRTDEILNGTLEEIDFDSNLKNKLNTKSDWNSTSGLSQILNKPTKLSQFTNDKGYQTSTEVDNKISGFATKSYVDNKVGVGNYVKGGHYGYCENNCGGIIYPSKCKSSPNFIFGHYYGMSYYCGCQDGFKRVRNINSASLSSSTRQYYNQRFRTTSYYSCIKL